MLSPISEQVLHHGAIGNGRVLSLVGPDTAIEWLCLPRFDSPSIFGSLLDKHQGGSFAFYTPQGEPVRGQLSYVRNTNVLVNRISTDGGEFEVYDFAPRFVEGLSVRKPCELVRYLIPLSGAPLVRVHFDPRPDYGRVRPVLTASDSGIDVSGTSARMTLFSNTPADYILGGIPFRLDRPRFFVLRYGAPGELPTIASVRHELALTIEGWRAWTRTCAISSFCASEVLRSALCLKLHIFEETGAIIASATTSIPEALATERTWDYRYCWLRDSAFVVDALRRLSYLQEGRKFVTFLRDVADGGPLQPVYGVGGERQLEEEILTHLSGFRGNGPVRVGNSAYKQVQNDLVGEMILCLETLLSDERLVIEKPEEYAPLIMRLVEEAQRVADKPDTGIWEYRSLMRQHTFSAAMCWAALDRGSRIARTVGKPELAEAWKKGALRLRQTVLERGYSKSKGMFTQALEGEFPDASNLLLASIGVVGAKDEMFRSTIRAYERALVDNGLMLRYRNQDDFGQTSSAFSICSFWWAEALAISGRLDDAIAVFRKVLKYQNSLGLFSEDIDPKSGMLLGNFPQAYTHVGLINAADTIGHMLDSRDGKIRAWRSSIRHLVE